MLTHCWMTPLNTPVGAIELMLFVCKPLQSGSSFHPFHIFLPMLGNLLGLVFHISPTVSTRWFLLVSTSSEISSSLIVSFPARIICVISSWLVTILSVSSSVTHFLLLIVLLLELSQVLLCYLTALTHHRGLI